MTDIRTRIAALALTFPTMSRAPLEPWDPDRLDRWAVGPAGTSGSHHAVAFILSVWNENSQRPARAAQQFLCDWFNGSLKAVENVIDNLQDGATPEQHKALGALERPLRAVSRAFDVGELQEARKLFKPLMSLVHTDSLLSKMMPTMSALAGALEPQKVEVDAVLRALHRGCQWRVGPFIVGDALGVWDDQHRAAFLAWASAPWWA